MARFKLVPYIIRIRNKRSEDYIDLTKIPTTNQDISLFDIFGNICKKYNKDVYLRSKEQKTLYIEDSSTDKGRRLISGIIKSGEYGYETDFYDTKLHKRISSARKEEYSEELPFFFLFHLATVKNSNRGFLILQKFKQFGVKTILGKAIQETIESLNKNLIIEINPLINEELLKVLKSADKLIELKLIKRKIPKDVADKNRIENYEDVYEERSFKIKRNKEIRLKIKEHFERVLRNIEYPYSEVKSEKYDEVKLIIKKGTTTSTISLEDTPRFRETMPLSPQKHQLEKGFPSKEFLSEKALDYLNIILKNNDENLIGG